MRVDPNVHPGQAARRYPGGRELVPVAAAPLPVAGKKQLTAALPARTGGDDATSGGGDARQEFLGPGVDIRNMTPRQMTEISMDLYVAGIMSYEEYSMLAFQAELHPAYDNTVGALTGQKAQPNRPRDFVSIWEERLAFNHKHNAADTDLIRRTERVLDVLRQFANPTNVFA